MKKLLIAVASAAIAVAGPALAADQPGSTTSSGAGQPATRAGTTDGTTAGTGTGADTGGTAPGSTTNSGVSMQDYQTLQQKLQDLQAQLDAIKAANGGQTPLEAAQAIQKQMDALKAAVAKAATASVTSGASKLSIGGNLQVWVGGATHPDSNYAKIDGAGFRLRRSEIALNGTIDPRLAFHFMGDFARASSTVPGTIGILQDLYVDQNLGDGYELLFGQMKLPLSENGQISSAHLATIERPLFIVGNRTDGTTAPTPAVAGSAPGVTPIVAPVAANPGLVSEAVPQWGDIREPQIQLRKTDPRYAIQLALSSGAGDYQNSVNTKYGKQVTAAVFVRPFGITGPQFGASGSTGAGYQFAAPKPAVAGFTTTPVLLKRNRGGVSFLWLPGRFILESEYMGGVDGLGTVPGIGTGAASALNVARHGEYGLLGYDLGGYKKGNGYQAVAMEDYWDPGFGNPRQTNTTVGLNHDMDGGHRRLQLNYVHQHFDGVFSPKTGDIDELLLAAGVNW